MSNFLPHQQRVVIEKFELDEKLAKLRAFMDLPAFANLPVDERGRLTEQEGYMASYADVLGRRIDSFKTAPV